MSSEQRRLSKFLSLILRHQPELIGLQLDPQGWVEIDELLGKAAASPSGMTIDRTLLLQTVRDNDKQRFTLSTDGQRIRAAQGHSIDIALQLPAQCPPAVLFHGTATRFLAAIRAQGLLPQSRLHVHLSADVETAQRVGARHGKPVVLRIDAAALHAKGQLFWQADNGVWLTDALSPELLALHVEEVG